MRLQLVTNSADATRTLGQSLARAITGPLLLLLRGDYGTGKTTFVQGLAQGLGYSEPARSPSYLIARVYASGARVLVHADLYRVETAAGVAELGLAELAGGEGVIAVEWPAQVAALLETDRAVLELDFAYQESATARLITAQWDELPVELVEVLHAAAAR